MTVPSTMTAAVLTGHGGYDKLVIRTDYPTPQPQAGEVLIKVGACGMNNTDINTRIGWYADAGEVNDDMLGGWGDTAIQFPRIQG